MKKLIFVLVFFASVQVVSGASQMAWRQVVPAAASTEGADGSFWRTDLTVFNPSEVEVGLEVQLIPSGVEGSMGESQVAALPSLLAPSQSVVVDDVLGSLFPGVATGALVVTARGADGSTVPIVVSSRTWSPTPEGQGSFGQGIPGIAWSEDDDLARATRLVAGLEASEAYRTNLGIVNLEETIEQAFAVEIFDTVGLSQGLQYYWLGPLAHVQYNDILDRFGVEGSGYAAAVRLVTWNDLAPGAGPTDVEPDFAVYGSKIDRRTNDPFYIEAHPGISGNELPRQWVIPVVAATEGKTGSSWRSDITIHYPGADHGVFVWIDLIPTGEGGADQMPPFHLSTINPGQTLVLEDILGERFSGHEVAALVVKPYGRQVDLAVTSRTWTPPAEGDGSLGQGIPGLALVSAQDRLVIPGIEASQEFRCNLGLVNPSRNLRETFEVEVYDSGGLLQGTLSYVMEPWSHLQANGVLEDLGLTGSGFTAVVTMTESENLFVNPSDSWDPYFMAYGSIVDQVTNDPTYVEGVSLAVDVDRDAGDWFDFEAGAPWYLCPEESVPEEATVVRAFDRDYHYFGAENHRSITREVEFPGEGEWNQVGLRFQLECPVGGDCDDWDRTGSLQMVLNPEDPEEEWEYLEIIRHITPYHLEMCEYVDVTPLASLLAGSQTLVSWIDTWVGPGHSAGEGWRVTYDFVFYPGEPRAADEVVNIWGRRNITLGYLDPDRNLDSQIDPVDVSIPADATRVEARLIATGHAFGNTDNCAEFCVLRQDVYVNGAVSSVLPWRTDCEHNPHSPQGGTWKYDRNGWCPGAIVVGHTIDITDLVTPGADNVIDFDVRTWEGEEYENTEPADYDPLEWISLQLYVYED